MTAENALAVFQGRKIRRAWHNEEWWFAIEDIVTALTDSTDPKQYINKMRQRDEELSKGWVQFVHTLSVTTQGGRQNMNCASTEGTFRIIQSIPSPKAEPFKLWLAKVGYERVQEIDDPELAQKRMKELYHEKGYSDEWIEKRVRGIAVRDELTGEWKRRGAKTDAAYSILTAEISKAAFGMTPSEYKKHKGLSTQNLRDHMDDLELILTMLGEATTTRITREKDSREFHRLKTDANDGGSVAGEARRNIEKKLGKSVVSGGNYLEKAEGAKRIREKSGSKEI
ncbi:MAG: Bro-N domain-containing protein [Candidatus Diapherotrites archaeon]|uniref:Bro-N domain-containing protein n=1 Tax=Candidatus Iainarchaeum sp. TaxID=3101447 RepID=A0A8T3YKU1_9ARCH|nr:Bro-N domain-containing protein [Candidatus Diapherotrites archaeon]